MSIRVIARVWSLASIGFLLLFLVGEGVNFFKLTSVELVEFILFPVGVTIGMVLAWKWEKCGGLLTIFSIIGFYAFHRLASGSFPRGWIMFAVAIPGVLFLISSFVRKPSLQPAQE